MHMSQICKNSPHAISNYHIWTKMINYPWYPRILQDQCDIYLKDIIPAQIMPLIACWLQMINYICLRWSSFEWRKEIVCSFIPSALCHTKPCIICPQPTWINLFIHEQLILYYYCVFGIFFFRSFVFHLFSA